MKGNPTVKCLEVSLFVPISFAYLAELQRRSSKILPRQCPLSKRFLSSDARFIAFPSIIDSLASPLPQGKIPPIETKCLMYSRGHKNSPIHL